MLISLDLETECNVPECPGYKDTRKCDHALDPHRAAITVIACYWEDQGEEVQKVYHSISDFKSFFSSVRNSASFLGHNLGFDIKMLRSAGVDFPVSSWEHDTMIMAVAYTHKVDPEYLINYGEKRKMLNKALGKQVHRNAGGFSLKVLAPYFANVEPFWETSDHSNDEYVAKDAKYTYKLYKALEVGLKQDGTYNFYINKLMSWARFLAEVEMRGVRLDLDLMNKMEEEAEEDIIKLKNQLDEAWAPAYKEYARIQRHELYQEYISKYGPEIERSPEKAQVIYKRALKSLRGKIQKIPNKMNLDSPAQLKWLFKEYFKLNIRNPEGDETTGAEVLEKLIMDGREDIQLFSDYKEKVKLLSSFFQSYKEKVVKDIMYCNFNMAGTRTGRLSCIEENQIVSMPGQDKKIRDVKAGDLVYSYNAEGKITINKVKRVIDNGYQECISVKWQGSGDGKCGELLCTPDHRLFHKYKGWVQASSLKRGDKLFHLRKRLQTNGRIRIYGTWSFMDFEEKVIKSQYFKAKSKLHIHHIDGDKSNNLIDNLIVLSPEEHTSLHAKEHSKKRDIYKSIRDWRDAGNKYIVKKKEESPSWKHETKFTLLKKLARARGRITYISDYDFDTFKNKCEYYKIDLKEVQSRYTSNGTYLMPSIVMYYLDKYKTAESVSKILGIGTRKLKEYCLKYGLAYNHQVLKISQVGIKRVYDLEIENDHNFIASEICVHNCSSPNLQQVPGSLHSLFIARPGKLLATFDMSAIEPRLIAFFSEDPTLCDIMIRGDDFHGYAAKSLIEYVTCDSKEVKKLYKKERDLAKQVDLSLFYGSGVNRLMHTAHKHKFNWSREECQHKLRMFKDMFQQVFKFKNSELDPMLMDGAVTNVLGRTYRIDDPEEVYMKGFNTLIQSSGSDLVVNSGMLIDEEFKKRGIDGGVLMLVHDELVVEIPENRKDECKDIIIEKMTGYTLNTVHGRIHLEVEGKIAKSWEK